MKDTFRSRRCCFTGPAPQMLNRQEDDIKVDLENMILRSVADGFTTFISGLTRGVGIWGAEIVVRLKSANPGLHLIAVIPWPDFDAEWEDAWRIRYRFLLSQTEYVKVLRPAACIEALTERNAWMVCHSARIIAVYNHQPGDTMDTVRQARICRVPIRFLSG